MVDKVIFVPRANAEAIDGWKNWAVISIIDPGQERVKLGKSWSFVLRLEFHDLDPIRFPNLVESDSQQGFMSQGQAEEIVRFVSDLPESVDGILIQCHAGVSRSAAGAKWVAGHFRVPFNKSYDKFNRHVYNLLIDAGKRLK